MRRRLEQDEGLCEAVRAAVALGVPRYVVAKNLGIGRDAVRVILGGVVRHQKPAAEIRHGTTSAYHNDNCRCDACTQAAADYAREYRERAMREGRRISYRPLVGLLDSWEAPGERGFRFDGRTAMEVDPFSDPTADAAITNIDDDS